MNSLFNLRPLYCCHHHHHHHHKSHVLVATQQTLVILKRVLSTSQLNKYYTLLNCTKNSNVKEIKESFLKLSKVYHPDNKETGSHQKFVQLKEAYDAVKDGPPAANDGSQYHRQTYNQTSSNSYSNYTDWFDLKQSYNRNSGPYARRPFGGPYARSSTPWEDLMRDRESSRRQHEEAKFAHRRSGTVNGTLFLGAIAWIVIYSCIMLSWDANFTTGNLTAEEFRRRSQADYQEFEERRRRQIFYGELERKRKKMTENNTKEVEETEKKSKPSPQPSQSSDPQPTPNSKLDLPTDSGSDNIKMEPVVS